MSRSFSRTFISVAIAGFNLWHSVHAQPAPPNRALSLNGDDAFVKLPSNSFTNLSAATIETWVKVNKLGSWSRVFDFGKEGNVVALTQHDQSTALSLEIRPKGIPSNNGLPPFDLRIEDLFTTNQWMHFAVVMGDVETRLYYNGMDLGKSVV